MINVEIKYKTLNAVTIYTGKPYIINLIKLNNNEFIYHENILNKDGNINNFTIIDGQRVRELIGDHMINFINN